MKKILSLLTLLIVAIGTSWATETAVSLVSYTVSDNTATCTNSDDENVTVVLSRTSSTLPNPASSNRGLRWQKNAVITATVPTGYKINSVKLTSGKNGNSVGSIEYTVTDGTSSLTGTWDNALNGSKQGSYTWTAGTGVTTTSWVLTNTGSTGDLYISAVTVTYEATTTTAPEITTDLAATADVTVGVAEDFSIVATGATSYQWYKDDVAIEGATAATYSYTAAAAGTVNIKCVASNTYGDTPSTVCAVTATAPSSAPTITTDLEAAYNVQKGQTQELSIVAENASSYQWYLDGEAIDGATSASYTYTAGSTIGATNEIYCKAINAAGSTNSTIATMTVTGSNACQLLQVQYSNNFYAFIKQPTDERPTDPYTITSYYLEGEDIPTIVSTGVTVSEGATWAVDGNTLTVTAEDETTTAEFTINAPVAVAPYTGLGAYTFTADDTWVKTGYAFDTASGKEGWKFAKNDESDGKLRNADGRTRIYLFVGPSKTITLTSGCSSDRNIRVFRNGTEVLGSTKLGKNGGTVSFNGDEDNAAMYEVRSAQTGGDGTIKIITVATTTEPVEIPSDGVATYVTKQALDFSTIDGDITAYAVTAVSATSATTVAVDEVPAGTALLLKGTTGSYDIEVIASASAITNLLLASDGAITGGDNIYAYSKTAKKFKKVASTVTIPAGKAYLQANAGDAIDIDFAGEATAITNVNGNANSAAPVKVVTAKGIQIGKYNIAGQQVK